MPKPTNHKPSHFGHRSRVKEKFLKFNGNVFSDYELLEILLFSAHSRADVKPLAKQLINQFGNISSVINADPNLLKKIPQINDNVLVSIKIIKEIITRNFKQQIDNKIIIQSWDSLIKYCQLLLANLKYEEFHIIFLDKKHQLISDDLYKEGSIENLIIDPVDIVKKALLIGAASLILVHNHPSGNVEPSKYDIENTRKITTALQFFNIKLYDHLIIGGDNQKYYSFRGNSLI